MSPPSDKLCGWSGGLRRCELKMLIGNRIFSINLFQGLSGRVDLSGQCNFQSLLQVLCKRILSLPFLLLRHSCEIHFGISISLEFLLQQLWVIARYNISKAGEKDEILLVFAECLTTADFQWTHSFIGHSNKNLWISFNRKRAFEAL